MIVEDVGGAGGMIGAARVMKAAPDGYSLLLATAGTHAINQTLYKKPLYNAATDFAPVALVASTPILLVTRKDLPVGNLPEFIAYAKANQATMQFGSPGAGSTSHLGCALFNAAIGVADHPRSLSQHRAGAAGSAGGAARLPVRPDRRRGAADRGQADQGDRDHVEATLGDSADARHRARAGPRRFRGRDLVRHLPAQGHAGRRSSASCTTPRSPP